MGQYRHTFNGEPVALDIREELVLQEMKRVLIQGEASADMPLRRGDFDFFLAMALWRIASEEVPGRPAPPAGVYGEGDET